MPLNDSEDIKKHTFEEFNVSIPNKIENVLETFNFNLNFISFSKNKKDPKSKSF